ncbi:MAG: 30S ribosome-binding factor RbfA [Planctomycetes bacterium]|nr:30S ribosome-binding factor RbfA [Planctomycetota bacterium]
MRPFRKEKVASLVRDIVGEALVHRLHDPRLATLTTITRVEMTRDLQIARIYLMVPGGETVERKTMAAIKSATGYLQRMVGSVLSLRNCPELRFEIDEAGKFAQKTLGLIEENRRQMEAKQAQRDATEPVLDEEPHMGESDDSSTEIVDGA